MSGKIKYRDISDGILDLIREKKLKDGDKIPSEKRLGEIFSVSHITVRKALGLLVKKGTLYKSPSKGCFIGKPVKGVRINKLIGIIYPEDEIFFYKIISDLDRRMSLFDYSPVVHVSHWSVEREKEIIGKFISLGVSGIISVPNSGCASLYQKIDVPLVFFDSYLDNCNVPYVITDDRSGAFGAVEHLIHLGHRKIAYIGSRSDKTAELRKGGYEDAMKKYKVPIMKNFCMEREYSQQWGFTAASTRFSTDDKPTAFFCGSDIIASGVIEYIRSVGLSIPDDISVVGFGNLGFSNFLGLTTVDQPISQISERIWKTILMLQRGEKDVGATVVSTSLIVRKSTARRK